MTSNAAPVPVPSPGAIGVETIGMTKRFGAFAALEDVSVKIEAGGFHALLGERTDHVKQAAGLGALLGTLVVAPATDAVHALGQVHRLEIGGKRAAQIAGLLQLVQYGPSCSRLHRAVPCGRTHENPQQPEQFDWQFRSDQQSAGRNWRHTRPTRPAYRGRDQPR